MNAAEPQMRPFSPQEARGDFPILGACARGGVPLVYFDNAATTQRPRCVLEAVDAFYETSNANIDRGVHFLGERATLAYGAARARVARALGAEQTREVVFTRGTTEAVNLVAQAWGGANLRAGDEILITAMEHHANIVPWQVAAQKSGAVLRVAPILDSGGLDLEAFDALLGERTKIVSVAHVSNVLGTVNPVAQIGERVRAKTRAVYFVDGAQGFAHAAVDVRKIGCDFYAVSAHKVFGPTGIGALYGRAEVLEAMPPYQTGGDMVRSVSFEKTVYRGIPQRFEAGTPAIAQAVGFAAALDYRDGFDPAAVAAHMRDLTDYASARLREVRGVRIYGETPNKAPVISFTLDGVHPHDLATVLDMRGVAVRAGHHCAQPLMRRYGVPAMARASFALYNTRAEVDVFIDALREAAARF